MRRRKSSLPETWAGFFTVPFQLGNLIINGGGGTSATDSLIIVAEACRASRLALFTICFLWGSFWVASFQVSSLGASSFGSGFFCFHLKYVSRSSSSFSSSSRASSTLLVASGVASPPPTSLMQGLSASEASLSASAKNSGRPRTLTHFSWPCSIAFCFNHLKMSLVPVELMLNSEGL